MAELSPSDELSNQLGALVNKDSGNIMLWQHFIMVTQASVAMCTVPRVLDLYSKCFSVLRQRSRTNPSIYDTQLLRKEAFVLLTLIVIIYFFHVY